MKTINKILLLTDFSEVADSATQYALNISEQLKSKIEILHIINTPVDWVKLPLDKEKLYPEIKSEIGSSKAKLSTLQMQFSKRGIEATESLVFNMGVENIPQYISKEKYDLIIMGSHGSKGFKELAIGSNAQKVIRKSQVPVLVVKKPPKSIIFNRIVMASTFEDDQKSYFKQMLNYSADLGPDLDLLYINTPYYFRETEEIDKMFSFFCGDFPNKNCGKYHVDALNEERGIQFFMSNSDANLFAIATSRKSQLSRLFSPSISEAIVNHLDIPVLVFHV